MPRRRTNFRAGHTTAPDNTAPVIPPPHIRGLTPPPLALGDSHCSAAGNRYARAVTHGVSPCPG
ncbi:MAG: hypothetical protein O6934_00960, partial [SAR324 cluster bacterium]|nr:hypothetical protein [SAR324 cluster bacterium]